MQISLWVKREVLTLFLEGKDLEIRINRGIVSQIAVGDSIVLNNVIRRQVRAIRRYANFELMLATEEHHRIHPRLAGAELLAALKSIFRENDAYWGVLVFELTT